MKVLCRVILGLWVSFAGMTMPAHASVTYLYTGDDFNSFSGNSPLTSSDFISASFTFASALPDNLNDVENPGTLLGWSITDQVNTVSSSAGDALLIFFSTNAEGVITGWGMQGDNYTGVCKGTCNGLGTQFNLPQIEENADYSYLDTQQSSQWFVQNLNEPGTWTIAPEPSAAVLLLLGLGVLIGASPDQALVSALRRLKFSRNSGQPPGVPLPNIISSTISQME